MDWGVFIGTMALIVALIFFVVAPPWIKRWLRKIDLLVEDIHEVRVAIKDPAFVSDVLARTITHGAYTLGEKGEHIPVPVPAVLEKLMHSAIDYAVINYGQKAYETIGEYVPQLIASAFSSDVAKENQGRSVAARGASKLGGGIRGLQALQHGVRKMGGEKLGVVGEILSALPQLLQGYQQLQESGILDKLKAGTARDTAGAARTSQAPSSGGTL